MCPRIRTSGHADTRLTDRAARQTFLLFCSRKKKCTETHIEGMAAPRVVWSSNAVRGDAGDEKRGPVTAGSGDDGDQRLEMPSVAPGLRRVPSIKEQASSTQPRLSDAQVEELKETWKLFDLDGDGFMTELELGNVIRSMGGRPTRATLRELIAEVDEDGNGKIDFEEFLTLMTRETGHVDINDEILAAFSVFDTAGKGYVSLADIDRTMRELGEHVSVEELRAMFAEADVDQDGRLTLDDMKSMVTGQTNDVEAEGPSQGPVIQLKRNTSAASHSSIGSAPSLSLESRS